MTLPRWNYSTCSHDPFTVPDDWKVAYHEPDLNKVIQCPYCGKLLKAGDGYRSLEIHVPANGLGCLICESCHKEEQDRRQKVMQGGR